MGGGGVCAGEPRGKAWVGRGGGDCRFVPAAWEPGETSAPAHPRPPPGGFFAALPSGSSYFSSFCKPSPVFLRINLFCTEKEECFTS